MPLPILYSFRRCPYAMRARAALIASGITVELREVELRDKPAAMLAASPKGSVPVLVLREGDGEAAGLAERSASLRADTASVPLGHPPAYPLRVLPDEKVIDESWDIMLWALRQHDPQSWLGKDDCHAQAALPLVIENDTTFKHNLDRYKYPERFPEQPQSAYRSAGEQFLQQLEQRLSTTPCLLGETFTLADAALLPFVRQFSAIDSDWFATAPYPALRAWLEQFTSSELFSLVMQKFPVWQPGNEPVTFGN